jgi:two-component system sensor histidine kinase YesM
MSMRISTKMIVGYVLLIVLPFLLFAVFIYYQLYDKLFTQYQLANQQNIEQLAGNLDSSLSKVESLQSIFQNSAALIDYLRGEYLEDRDLIYYYLREISPAISFAYLGEPSVDDLTIYPKTQERLLTVPGFREYGKIYEKLTEDEIGTLNPAKGLWKLSMTASGLSLSYYNKIYNESFTSELAIIELKVKPELFGNFLQNIRKVHPDNAIFLMNKDGYVYQTQFNAQVSKDVIADIVSAVRNGSSKTFLVDRDQFLVNTVSIPRLGLTVIEMNKRDTLFKFLKAKQLWFTGGIALLALLSLLYYVIVSSLTKRIMMLTRHMRRVGAESLGNHFTGKSGTDEIGYLITSYNAMISRMDELVNHVQKVELLKKEADFKMLQAQIQPHFLYNTLETMRMLARSNHADKVADMAFSLGNLLRYSLSKNNDTTLQEELDHVRAYIAIHQIRMPDLRFELEADEALLSIHCPRFILQPLVENSMIHGLSRKRGGKRIAVRMRRSEERAIIEVSDNGEGIPSDKLSVIRQLIVKGTLGDGVVEVRGMGIGLNNVAERIKAYFGDESEMSIDSTTGEGTTCALIIVLKENHNAQTDDRG